MTLLAAPLLGACASAGEPEQGSPALAAAASFPGAFAGEAAYSGAQEAPPAAPGAPAEPAAEPAPPPPKYRLADDDLALWNEPAFRNFVTQSYAAETDVEPPFVAEESKELFAILELIAANKLDRAVERLQKGRGPAASAAFDFTLANIHFQADELDAAVEAYQVAVQKFPKFLRAWRQLGVCYVRAGEYAQAAEALSKVVSLGGSDPFTYGLLGFAYGNLGNSLSAESAYRMAVLLDPHTLDWKIGLARSLFLQERFSDVAALCGQLIAEQPDSADMWLLQANAFIGMNEPLRAAENYEFVDGLGRSTFDSLNNLGDIYVNEGYFGQGVDAYIRAMELDAQGNPARAMRAARLLVARGALADTAKLVAYIERRHDGTLLEAEYKELLKLQARLAVEQGADAEQVRVLEKIVELDPLDGEALILLGTNAWESGDAERAVFLYERAAMIDGFEAEGKVAHAQLLVRQGKYSEALPMLRRAQSLEPSPSVQEYLDQIERYAQNR